MDNLEFRIAPGKRHKLAPCCFQAEQSTYSYHSSSRTPGTPNSSVHEQGQELPAHCTGNGSYTSWELHGWLGAGREATASVQMWALSFASADTDRLGVHTGWPEPPQFSTEATVNAGQFAMKGRHLHECCVAETGYIENRWVLSVSFPLLLLNPPYFLSLIFVD